MILRRGRGRRLSRCAWNGHDLLKPGDFLYFAEGGRRVDHVGVYAGGGQLIHATSTGVPACCRDGVWTLRSGALSAAMTGARRIEMPPA